MSLEQQLEQLKQQFVAESPAAVHGEIFRHIREQQQSGIAYGVEEGSKAKDFALRNSLGEKVSLYEELAKGPVVLTFYRGGWCPYCNMQLKSYQKVLPEIRALGAQLIAVSPQSPDNTLSHAEKAQLEFQVLSDPNGIVAAGYNILYEVPDYIQDVFKNVFGLSLVEYNATDRWILPVPATFMIDETGIVRSAYVDPDFLKRQEPQDILDRLNKL